ncbi:MAG: hypothetical protein [Olavius algarvensis Gamma 1 endosymbiont]|nr:MAG: hypothetical protein [Olavius algarvensis Gamma 1 endosymbiont]
MIDPDAAIEIARKRSIEKGWAFPEPVEVVSRHRWFGGLDRFEIETNAGQRGTKSRFTIDAATGEITSEGYIPR